MKWLLIEVYLTTNIAIFGIIATLYGDPGWYNRSTMWHIFAFEVYTFAWTLFF